MKKIKYLILTLILTLVGVGSASAATDFSNAKLKVEGIDEHSQENAFVRIYDAVFDETKDDYTALITKDNTNIPNSIDGFDLEYYHSLIDLRVDNNTTIENVVVNSTDYQKAAERFGNVYITFYEHETGSKYNKISETILVEKPSNLKLSRRIVARFFNDSTSFSLKNLNNISTERKITYKIGEVTDKAILNKIKNGSYQGLEELLAFGKNDTKAVSTSTVGLGYDLPAAFEQTDLIEGHYYYAYLVVEDENGTYLQIEDVNLYQALKTSLGELWLCDVNDSNFVWNLEQTEWEKFAEEVKQSEIITTMLSDSTVEYDSEKMIITYNQEGQNSIKVQFNYNNGIVSNEVLETTSDTEKLIASLIQGAVLNEFADKFNYDAIKMNRYLEENDKLELSKDGIEFIMKELKVEEKTEGMDASLESTYFETLKFNLLNGLTNYKEIPEVTEEIENPDTGLYGGLAIIALIAVLGTVTLIKTKKLNKFPQVK